MKNLLLIGGVVLVVLIGGSLLSRTISDADPTVLSQSGLHWHPQLEIFVKGVWVEIPQNIGIGPHYAGMPTFDSGMRMTAIHTHDDVPVIHLEFPGLVREDDITLGNFFAIWGKDLRSFGENVLPSDERGVTSASRPNVRPSDERGSTEASRPNVRMTVNGRENTEFENYVMHDGDRIELRYD